LTKQDSERGKARSTSFGQAQDRAQLRKKSLKALNWISGTLKEASKKLNKASNLQN